MAILFPGDTDGIRWMTKAGVPVLITDMEDNHLDNAINMLEVRVAITRRKIKTLQQEKSRRKGRKEQAEKELKEKLKRDSIQTRNAGRLFREND
jgi:hypothetical protein